MKLIWKVPWFFPPVSSPPPRPLSQVLSRYSALIFLYDLITSPLSLFIRWWVLCLLFNPEGLRVDLSRPPLQVFSTLWTSGSATLSAAPMPFVILSDCIGIFYLFSPSVPGGFLLRSSCKWPTPDSPPLSRWRRGHLLCTDLNSLFP